MNPKLIIALRLFGISEKAVLRLLFQRLPRAHQAPHRSGVFLTNRIRRDGAGSQIIHSFFSLAFARQAGIPFVHRQIETVEHVIPGSSHPEHDWRSVFQFATPPDCPAKLTAFSLSSRLHVLRALSRGRGAFSITSNIFHRFTDQEPQALTRCRGELREAYSADKALESRASGRLIFHLRRGDVTAENHPDRFTSAATLVSDLEVIRRKFGRTASNPVVITEHQLHEFEMEILSEFEVWVVRDPREALGLLSGAGVLVTGISSFSYLAALVSKNEVIYRRFWHPPLADWHCLEDLRSPANQTVAWGGKE